MPRMFDLLRGGNPPEDDNEKKGKRQEKQGQPEKKEASQVNFPKQIFNGSAQNTANHLNEPKRILNEMYKNALDNEEKAKVFYDKALKIVTELISKTRSDENIEYCMSTINDMLDELFNNLLLGDSILANVYEKRAEEYYLPYHIVNVMILASFLGLRLGLNKSKMRDLGLACIFCDIGLDALKEIVDKPTKLDDDELKKVKMHIDISVKIMGRIQGINDIVKTSVKLHHERVDGSGYPNGYHSDRINMYAKIIGLVDTYEAMTHKRSYREGINGHKTIKLLLSSLKGAFDYEAMKLLINSMSVYPIGTIVELDSGEIARVIGVKPGSPLRPLIAIIQDSDGNILPDANILDLSTCEAPSIINSL